MTGYGSQALALKYLGVEFETWKVVEFDKKVIKAYNEIHNTSFQDIDIRDVKELECDNQYLNICTYSFPCQDLSKAGKGKGMTKGENTRSGLLWEVERILLNTHNKPQVLLMENVPDVIGTSNINDFKLWVEQLEKMGYSNYVECLNGKNYGIPQNRNRAFMVSILGEYSYTFPSKIELKHRLKDMLENEVDENYYLSEKYIGNVNKDYVEKGTGKHQSNAIICYNDIMRTLNASDYKCPQLIKMPICINSEVNGKQPSLQNRIYDTNAISTAMTTSYQTNIIIPEATKNGYAKKDLVDRLVKSGKLEGGEIINHSYTNKSKKENSRLNPEDYIESSNGVLPTLHTRGDTFGYVEPINLVIRKLTPTECFRLMGVKDSDSSRLTCSNSQKYALAGNSIITTVLMAIFGELLQIEWRSKVDKLLDEMKG